MTQSERDVELFGLICDVVERAWQRWPVDSWRDDVCFNTSTYARAAASRVMDAIDPEWRARVVEEFGRDPEWLERARRYVAGEKVDQGLVSRSPRLKLHRRTKRPVDVEEGR